MRADYRSDKHERGRSTSAGLDIFALRVCFEGLTAMDNDSENSMGRFLTW